MKHLKPRNNMKFIYLFIVSLTLLCIRHCSAQINWTNRYFLRFANNCDFKLNDLTNISSLEEECGELCFNTPPCTHFVWSQKTCWLKTTLPSAYSSFIANIEKTAIAKPNSTCGFLHISWTNNWAYNCNFPDNILEQHTSEGKDCGPLCEKNVNCTHFTWQILVKDKHKPKPAGSLIMGTCYIQTGGALKEQESFSPNGVCGIRAFATVPTTTSPIEDCTCDC